jgi:hypothetical protein
MYIVGPWLIAGPMLAPAEPALKASTAAGG